MKKLLPAILVFFILFFFYSSTPSFVLAAPCSPVGTNIVANFDRKNLEFIAKNTNCSGPIPITILITPVLVQRPELLVQVQKDLKELNFNPTWRPWGFVNPNSPELQDWITAFSYLKIGQLQAWNEWNRYKEAGSLNPARDAQVIQALLDARDAGKINIPIGNTPLDLLNYTDMNYRDYWTAFYNECQTCLDRLDFIVSNVYAPSQYGPNSVNEFIKVWQGELDFLRNLGVNLSNKFFIISEAGLAPGAYSDFNQRLRDTLLFAQALEDYILANPGAFPNLDQITFLLMNDDTGEQFLIYRECDENGENCVWKVTNYLIFNFNVPGSLLPPGFSLTCTPSNPGDPDSRPIPCDACNVTDLLTPSCATAFTVHDRVTYQRGDVDFWCPEPDGNPWLEKDWGGIVTVDPSDTTIPFVGKKEQEDEQKYLADYFEGTGYYYRPPYNFNNSVERRRLIEEGGVWRKLAPQSLQDKYKKDMVERAIKSKASAIQEGVIHDYLVEYNGESALLSDFKGHFPPEDPKERGKWEKETKWGKLWVAVPMFSREDTHGYIIPYLGARIKDSFEILNPDAQVEKVPHLARLYEASQAINLILLPLVQEATQAQGKIKTLLASAEKQVLGEKIILAQAAPDFPYGCKWYYSTNPSDPTDCSCMASGNCRGEHGGCCPPHGFWGVCGWDDCQPQIRCPNPPENGCPGAWIVGGPLSPEGHECGLPDPLPVDACLREAITDPNPNDDLCCSPIQIALSATDQFVNSDYIECGVEVKCWENEQGVTTCRDACEQTKSHAVNRQVGIQLLHPYLYEIWQSSTEKPKGFFNIIRPETAPEFEELDASSTIAYSYSSGNAAPSMGNFYYPYLGGIQKAKKWVIDALNPLRNTKTPGLASPITPFSPTTPTSPVALDYTFDYRNPKVTISEAAKASAIRIALASWPNSKIESHWDFVYNQAVSHGWNPAFVIALWIEESGASGVYTFDLGCLGADRDNLSGQLDCLFARPYANTSFEEFMCMYSEGHYPCLFEINPNFPGNLKHWYDRLTQ